MSDIGYSTNVSTGDAAFSDYVALLKPRVMSLVVFTAFVGLVAAPNTINPMIALASILFIALGAGASGALNMWCDADIDQVMHRTRNRPVPSGKVSSDESLALGLGLSGLSIVMLGLAANLFAAGLLAFTIFFYVVIYSLWLKRITPQNIVIGGAAGALPPVIGWVAASGAMSVEAWLMFALIFVWTPPHFWALALFMRSDYDNANIPMMTVTHGRRTTRTYILGYSFLLAVIAFANLFTPLGGILYFMVAIILNPLLLIGAIRIWMRDEDISDADNYRLEKDFFRLSLIYLFLHFGAILADATIHQTGWNSWV
ncbi:MAG: heme o synthase [Aestuariivita sp.]|nr:heme o synthase [Aestuariivita sp.]